VLSKSRSIMKLCASGSQACVKAKEESDFAQGDCVDIRERCSVAGGVMESEVAGIAESLEGGESE
jgi:hypothetical protein